MLGKFRNKATVQTRVHSKTRCDPAMKNWVQSPQPMDAGLG